MNKLNRLLLFVSAIALILLMQQPQIVVATSNQTIQSIQSIEQEAEELYQQNQYSEAIALLKTAIKQYQQQGDQISRVIATRNLALIYQKLGEWEQAKATLTQAEQLIQAINHEPERSQLLAQVGEVKGQVELSLGRSQAALETWQQATSLYEEQGNIPGLIQCKIYQAYALQALGLYSQSIKTLTATKKQLQNKPDTLIKAQTLLNLGDVLNRVGKYQTAQTTLHSGLAIAKKLQDNSTIADVFLSLGNNARFQDQLPVALDYYQQAIDIAPQPSIQLRAKLDLLGVLISLQDKKATSNLVTEIQQLLTQLPDQQTTIQGQISLARHLLNLDTEPRQIAELLVSGIQQAQKLDIKRTEAEALGVLGHLYERNQQWSAARAITQKALVTAQSINARELTYQWQWQLGRILKAQGNRAEAIAAYTQATDNLQIF